MVVNILRCICKSDMCLCKITHVICHNQCILDESIRVFQYLHDHELN